MLWATNLATRDNQDGHALNQAWRYTRVARETMVIHQPWQQVRVALGGAVPDLGDPARPL